MQMAYFMAFGIVVLLIDLPVLLATIAEISCAPKMPSQNQLRWFVGAGFAWLVGIGLLGLRKWAALYFSIPLFCFGAWFFITSIEPIGFPLNVLYMTEASR